MKNNEMKKIVLPEGNDERVLKAAAKLIEEKVCHPVLIGDVTAIKAILGDAGYTAVEPDTEPLITLQAQQQEKGKHFPVDDVCLVQGSVMVRDGAVDGIVSGAVATTSDVFRTYVKTIGARNDVSRVTSCFLMENGAHRYIFADCGLNPESNAEQLAETAFLSAEFAKTVDIAPKVAFLTFQTRGSAASEATDRIANATGIAKRTHSLDCDGPLQFDSAFDASVAEKKVSDSTVAGQATVYIFPDLASGNIGYKIAERLGGYQATGPLFLGFAKPAYDLSRGCSSNDIVRVVKLAVEQV